jgi:hypothetical protein
MKVKLGIECLERRDNPSGDPTWIESGWDWIVDAGGVVLTVHREVVRLPVHLGVALTEDRLPFAAELLEHSLRNNPADVVYQDGSGLSDKIQESPEYKAALDAIKEQIKDMPPGPISGELKEGIKFEADRDLFLAIHNARVTYSGHKNADGTFTLTVSVVDTYNFESQALRSKYYGDYYYQGGIKGAFTAVINELAVAEELLTGINPFKVTVLIKE